MVPNVILPKLKNLKLTFVEFEIFYLELLHYLLTESFSVNSSSLSVFLPFADEDSFPFFSFSSRVFFSFSGCPSSFSF